MSKTTYFSEAVRQADDTLSATLRERSLGYDISIDETFQSISLMHVIALFSVLVVEVESIRDDLRSGWSFDRIRYAVERIEPYYEKIVERIEEYGKTRLENDVFNGLYGNPSEFRTLEGFQNMLEKARKELPPEIYSWNLPDEGAGHRQSVENSVLDDQAKRLTVVLDNSIHIVKELCSYANHVIAAHDL